MKQYLVLYYSKTGNSKFLAEKVAGALAGDLKSIRPPLDHVLFLYMLSALKIGVPTGISSKELENYEEVVLFGPVWGGLLIAPLRSMLKKCIRAAKPVHFAVSCEVGEEEKDGKYGYTRVLREAEKAGGELVKTTAAFSTALVATEPRSVQLSEKTRLTEENFEGPVRSRLEDFIDRIKSDSR